MTDPYVVLGVEPTASDTEIRRAYVALARRFHPDANPGGEDRMREINEAWAVLGDRERRRDHDRRAANGTTADAGFRPDDLGEDGFDPRAQPDVPYRPHTVREVRRQGALSIAPVAVFAASLVVGGAGIFFNAGALIGLGVALFSLACVAMVVVLLLAMVDARRDEG